MSKADWDFWYEWNEAAIDLKGTDGKVSTTAGLFRDGGSYLKRFSNVAVWNTVMENYDYSLDKWYELLNA
jgi:putative spermidine/putrescine transport system substrate-binding protein